MAEVANGEVRPPGLEVDDPRSNLVFAEGLVESDYQVGTIVLGDSTSTSAIICITEVDIQLLVALPVGVWHKKPVKRLFSPRDLSKVLQCSVVASQDGDRETAAPDRHVKVWIGLLVADLEPQIEFVFDQDPDHPFVTMVNMVFLLLQDWWRWLPKDSHSSLRCLSKEKMEVLPKRGV